MLARLDGGNELVVGPHCSDRTRPLGRGHVSRRELLSVSSVAPCNDHDDCDRLTVEQLALMRPIGSRTNWRRSPISAGPTSNLDLHSEAPS